MEILFQIKSVPNSSGQANFIATQSSSSSTFVSKTEEYIRVSSPASDNLNCEPPPLKVRRKSQGLEVQEMCATCQDCGTSANMVR